MTNAQQNGALLAVLLGGCALVVGLVFLAGSLRPSRGCHPIAIGSKIGQETSPKINGQVCGDGITITQDAAGNVTIRAADSK